MTIRPSFQRGIRIMNVTRRDDAGARFTDYRADLDERTRDLTFEFGDDSTRC
jgi:hypothetical protein